METSDGSWVAGDACTLPTAERPLRMAEFGELFGTALRGVTRVRPTLLRLELDAAALEPARRLAARESGCCSFFTFGFGPAGPATVHMDVSVPAGRVAVLDGLAAQAAGSAGSA